MVALLIATPVFAQGISEKTGINTLVGAAPSITEFVKIVALSDMFESQRF